MPTLDQPKQALAVSKTLESCNPSGELRHGITPDKRTKRKAILFAILQRIFSLLPGTMDELIKLIKTHRVTAGLTERIRLAEEIFRLIGPNLHLFVFSTVPHHTAEDVFQEVLKAVVTSLKKFQGDTVKEFWAWCYGIARHQLNDHYRSKAADRMQPMPPEELWQMIDAFAQASPISPAVRHDLEYAMKLLTRSKPECYDFLWNHFVIGLDCGDIAEDRNMSYDGVRMENRAMPGGSKLLVS
jgi:DNA-directed RNA polymerase specialized sigma24 family protein